MLNNINNSNNLNNSDNRNDRDKIQHHTDSKDLNNSDNRKDMDKIQNNTDSKDLKNQNNKNNSINYNNQNTQKNNDNYKNNETKLNKTNLNRSKNPIIVGFDPGLTVGIAILDFSGNLLFLNSFSQIAKSEIINIILQNGKAVLIATDVENIPKSVKKLSSSLNSKIYSPSSDVSVSYKKELVDKFLNNVGFDLHLNDENEYFNSNSRSFNAHERDSLSAAIIAYNHYEQKLNQLEKKFLEAKRDSNFSDKVDLINENYYEILNQAKSFLINDNPISIAILKAFEEYGIIESDSSKADTQGTTNNDNTYVDNAQNKAINDNNEDTLAIDYEKFNKIKIINKSQEKQLKTQSKLIDEFKIKNTNLLNEINEKDQKINKLEKDLKVLSLKESKAILKDKELASKIQLLKTIQIKYKEEKELRESLEEKLNKRLVLDDFNELSIFTSIKIIDSFTKNGLNQANTIFKLKKGDVIYLKSSKGGGSQTAKLIANLKIKAIIANTDEETIPPQAQEVFEEEEIPIINKNDIDIKFFDDYAVADSKELDDLISKWNSNQKEKSTEKAQNELLNVINEYRVERKRDI